MMVAMQRKLDFRPRATVHALAAITVLAAAGSHPTARADTLGDGWAWRRPLTFRQAASDAPGDNIAWAEFYTNGAQQTDGADLRITTAERAIVPHKIMQIS